MLKNRENGVPIIEKLSCQLPGFIMRYLFSTVSLTGLFEGLRPRLLSLKNNVRFFHRMKLSSPGINGIHAAFQKSMNQQAKFLCNFIGAFFQPNRFANQVRPAAQTFWIMPVSFVAVSH